MSSTTVVMDVKTYVAAVKACFGDLPDDDRRELLEDLEQHLAEVAAEDEGSLVERLGSPEAYADELRASAGLPARGTTRWSSRVPARDTARSRTAR